MGLTGRHLLGLHRGFAAVWLVFLLSVGLASAQSMEDQASRLLRSLDTLSARIDMTDNARAAAFLDIAEKTFNIDQIAAASLPRTLKLSPAAQQAYEQAFRVHLSRAYVESQRRGATVSRVVGVRQRQDKPPIVILSTQSGGTLRRSSWVLCSNETFLICQIEVEGVRLANRHRADFSALIRRDGFAAFLKALRAGALVRL